MYNNVLIFVFDTFTRLILLITCVYGKAEAPRINKKVKVLVNTEGVSPDSSRIQCGLFNFKFRHPTQNLVWRLSLRQWDANEPKRLWNSRDYEIVSEPR
jgi:hypothetical protein